jgi:2-dehydropantoate 2-reductase
MHHDLQRGRPLEIRWLSGGVVHLGNAVDIATPLNRAIADVLALYEAGAPATIVTRTMENSDAA